MKGREGKTTRPALNRRHRGWSASGPHFHVWDEQEIWVRAWLEDITAGRGETRAEQKSQAAQRPDVPPRFEPTTEPTE